MYMYMSRHLSTPGKMCFSAEVSLITSGVLVLVGVCMMIRRLPLDVMLAGFVLMLGVIQMIEFGIHSKLLQSSEAGRLLHVTLLTQCAVLALGVWAMFGGATSGGLAVVTTGVLLAGVCVVVTSNFSAKPGSSGHIEWSKDHGPLLGGVMGGLYLFGLFAPLVLITVLAPTISGIAVGCTLLGYGLFSALFVYLTYPPKAFSSMWCVLATFFAMLAWGLALLY
jgi:hypothetical protein